MIRQHTGKLAAFALAISMVLGLAVFSASSANAAPSPKAAINSKGIPCVRAGGTDCKLPPNAMSRLRAYGVPAVEASAQGVNIPTVNPSDPAVLGSLVDAASGSGSNTSGSDDASVLGASDARLTSNVAMAADPSAVSSGQLSYTGANIGVLAALGAALVGAGLLVWGIARRRMSHVA